MVAGSRVACYRRKGRHGSVLRVYVKGTGCEIRRASAAGREIFACIIPPDPAFSAWQTEMSPMLEKDLRALIHDLRNRIAPIRNAAYLLRLRAGSDTQVRD